MRSTCAINAATVLSFHSAPDQPDGAKRAARGCRCKGRRDGGVLERWPQAANCDLWISTYYGSPQDLVVVFNGRSPSTR